MKYIVTYVKENSNINEHRRVIVKLNSKNIFKSAYRDTLILVVLCYFITGLFLNKSEYIWWAGKFFDWGHCPPCPLAGNAITSDRVDKKLFVEKNRKSFIL